MTQSMSRLFAILLATSLVACVAAPEDQTIEATQEAVEGEDITWRDGEPADKEHPTDEDEIARYDFEQNIMEVLPGYEDAAYQALLDSGVPAEKLDAAKVRLIENPWIVWWPQVICENYYYRVYKNASCNRTYNGYGYIYNNWWSGTSTVVDRHTYKRCGFCPGCGYCVERKNAIVGNYEVHDQLFGNGPIISSGNYKASACYVY